MEKDFRKSEFTTDFLHLPVEIKNRETGLQDWELANQKQKRARKERSNEKLSGVIHSQLESSMKF